MHEPTLRGVGEDALVASVITALGGGSPGDADGLLVGPGDDAAVLRLAGPLVVSTDTLVEGHDFRRDWSTAFDVGVKTAAQTLADVAAMGARPVGLLVSLAAPAELALSWAHELTAGLAAECGRAGATVVGGDVSAAGQVVLTGTALGVLTGTAPAVLRSGARPGDVVALAGRTGSSAAGLALLAAGSTRAGAPTSDDWAARLLTAHRRPAPAYPAGPAAAAAGATALIDVSDGLLRDAARIAVASGAVLDLDPAALTPGPDLVAAGARLGVDPTGWVLTGGEDHALLGCFPAGTPLPADHRPVGVVLPAGPQGTTQVLVGGHPWVGDPGWRHFGPGEG